jgi:hypothetical protein
MKNFVFVLLTTTTVALSVAAQKKETSFSDVSLSVTEVRRSGTVAVDITNASRRTIKIWKDSNSWGAARWRVLRVRNGQVETFFQNPDVYLTKNYPAFDEIVAGGHLDQRLDLNGRSWCRFAHCNSDSEQAPYGPTITFEQGDLVIAVYDVPFTVEAGNSGVWYGVASASTTVK